VDNYVAFVANFVLTVANYAAQIANVGYPLPNIRNKVEPPELKLVTDES
jgi:hypothetical protein